MGDLWGLPQLEHEEHVQSVPGLSDLLPATCIALLKEVLGGQRPGASPLGPPWRACPEIKLH